ncbi:MULTISPECIES: substrate import-associated zinc metallohydrolase lipoprotein [unclassified Sphingobacterium]|uniref:substrate import-associated zinc metallohydrolase lipoprotein n=1 Tax=unclassified Sphingobacterium TaxID=2609468 RepID=UPI0020C53654|nr:MULTISPECIES: substrate import-associated zinc metallohydrolase lipoprotein [unclassified Sphingobacterium]
MKHYKCAIFLLLISLLTSCAKEETLPDEPIVDLGGERWANGPIDRFIFQEFIKSYNIEIKYKWTPFEINFNRTLVPPQEKKVIPVLTAVRDIWMKPYEKVAGKEFLKRYSLSKFILVGSAEYQNNGTIILGTAEGGTKVVLYVVNDFDFSKPETVSQMLHTIHHEFAHILHQNIHYPQAWRGISTAWYTQTWFNTPEETANAQGFVSSYAKSAEQEDFVETIAYLLVEGQEKFDALVKANTPVEATFRLKESIVVQYYKEVFNIDFRALQREVRAAFLSLTKPTTK